MKSLSRSLSIFVTSAVLFAYGCANISNPTGVAITPPSTPSGMTWVHPGALDSKEELDFVKAQIQAGAQPWKGEYDRIKHSSYANQTPHALTHINSATGDANVSRDDAIGAYTQALLWVYSGDETYAFSSR